MQNEWNYQNLAETNHDFDSAFNLHANRAKCTGLIFLRFLKGINILLHSLVLAVIDQRQKIVCNIKNSLNI